MFAKTISILPLGSIALRALLVSADAASYCPPNSQGACYAVTVPDTTAKSSSGDIYFQISAPSTVSWVGFGQSGDGQMAGANIFALWQSADGKNVTLSPRHGAGNFQPKLDSSARVTVLGGSGVSNGKMTVNVRCSSCLSWNGGSMSPTDSSSGWIWSVKKGDPIMSDDLTYSISQHTYYGDFKLDLTKAVDTTGSANPLDTSSKGTASTGSSSSASDSGSSNGASAGSSDGGSSSGTPASYTITHGVLMSSALLIIMPAGALLKRLGFSSRSALVSNPTSAGNRFRSLPHAIVEFVGLAEITAGVALGIYIANKKEELGSQAHTVIGLIVFVFVILQAMGGILAYWMFTSKPGKPRIIGRVHQWLGRSIFVLGIINGGLGIQLVGDDPNSANIIYAVIAAVVTVIYVSIIAKWYVQRARQRKMTNEKSMIENGNGSNSGSS